MKCTQKLNSSTLRDLGTKEFAFVHVCVYTHAEMYQYKGESNKENKKAA